MSSTLSSVDDSKLKHCLGVRLKHIEIFVRADGPPSALARYWATLAIIHACLLVYACLTLSGDISIHYSRCVEEYPTLLNESTEFPFRNNYVSELTGIDRNVLLDIRIHVPRYDLRPSHVVFIDDGPEKSDEFNIELGNIHVNWTYDFVRNALEDHDNLSFSLESDVYVGYSCVTSRLNRAGFHLNHPACQSISHVPASRLVFGGSYDLCVGLCHTSSHVFGHFIVDFLTSLSALPRSILERCYIITTRAPFYEPYFHLLGVSPGHVIEMSGYDYVFARHFVTSVPTPCCFYNLYFIQHLRAIIRNSLKLDKLKPSKYVIFLRHGSREIANSSCILDHIQHLFPMQAWEVYTPSSDAIKTIRYFNSVALLFIVHGSGMGNVLFMQRGTSVCEVTTKTFVNFYFSAIVGLGLNYFIVRDEGLEHLGVSTLPIPDHQLKSQIGAGLRVLSKAITRNRY